jgi:hypothetical protein
MLPDLGFTEGLETQWPLSSQQPRKDVSHALGACHPPLLPVTQWHLLTSRDQTSRSLLISFFPVSSPTLTSLSLSP